jgi:putative hydrolase of the HAD superfamily
MQQALLLDFGSVISISLFEQRGQIERTLGLEKGCLTWAGPFDIKTDALWAAMQNDEITEREYWGTRAREIGELAGEKNWTMLELFDSVRNDNYEEVIREEMAWVIRFCDDNDVKIGILSNELELFYGKPWIDGLRLMDKMSCFIDATTTNVLKPDPLAYQMAIDALGVAPENIVFLDDQMRNVIGAEKIGINAIHFDITRPEACFQRAINQFTRLSVF